MIDRCVKGFAAAREKSAFVIIELRSLSGTSTENSIEPSRTIARSPNRMPRYAIFPSGPVDFASSSFLIIGLRSPALSASFAILDLVAHRVSYEVTDA